MLSTSTCWPSVTRVMLGGQDFSQRTIDLRSSFSIDGFCRKCCPSRKLSFFKAEFSDQGTNIGKYLFQPQLLTLNLSRTLVILNRHLMLAVNAGNLLLDLTSAISVTTTLYLPFLEKVMQFYQGKMMLAFVKCKDQFIPHRKGNKNLNLWSE